MMGDYGAGSGVEGNVGFLMYLEKKTNKTCS